MANWVIVYKSNNPNLTEIVKSVLKDNKIDVVIMNKMDSMHRHLSNGDIELHVKPNDAIRAKHIIEKNQL